MAKFIKFNVVNSAAATGATGANAKTVVIGLTGRAAQAAGYQTLTLTVSTSISAAVNPTIATGAANPLTTAVRAAMTANPGGVTATAQLGVDQAATPAQMYFRTATFA